MQRHERQVAEVDRLRARIRRLSRCRGGGLEPVPRLEEIGRKRSFGDRCIVDLNTFAYKAQVGGGVQPDLVELARLRNFGMGGTVLGEDGRDESAGGSLAFRAGNVDGVQTIEIGRLKTICKHEIELERGCPVPAERWAHLVPYSTAPFDHFWDGLRVHLPSR